MVLYFCIAECPCDTKLFLLDLDVFRTSGEVSDIAAMTIDVIVLGCGHSSCDCPPKYTLISIDISEHMAIRTFQGPAIAIDGDSHEFSTDRPFVDNAFLTVQKL